MPNYRYTAIDSNGAKKSGKVEASSPDEANAKLSQMGLMVATMKEEGGKGGAKGAKAGGKPAKPGKAGKGFAFGKVISTDNLAIFTRQLATLLQAGLPILRSLEVM